MSRLGLAFVLAPLLPALAGGAVFAVVASSPPAGLMVAVSVLVFGYAALLCGTPLLILLRRRGRVAALAMLGVGLLGAAVATLLLSGIAHLAGQGEGPWLASLGLSLLSTLPIGALSALSLWWLGLRTPQRSA